MKSKRTTKKDLSRRDFIKTTAVGVGATALAGLGSKEAKAQDMPFIENWDKEADVVVLGYGGAGAVAAMAAADAGVQVLILEKMSKGGGTTRVSGGGFMTPTNVDDAITYYDALRQGSTTSHEMIEVLVREAAKNFDYVKALGGQYVDYGGAQFPAFPGAAAVRKYHIIGPSRDAENLWQMLDAGVKARAIEVMYDSPAKELVTNSNREVIGVIAESKGRKVAVKAKRAVILTTGGYEFNEAMLQDFVISRPYLTTASPGNTGDGISMAQKVGAALWHMTMPLGPYLGFAYPDLKGSYLSLGVPTRGYIVVDKYSQRVINEVNSGAHSMLWAKGIQTFSEDSKGLVEFPAIPAYVVFDEVSRARGPVIATGSGYAAINLYTWSKDNTAEIAKGWIVKGDTLEELATKSGLDPSALVATVNKYNGYCADKNDPDFGRSSATLVPITTPPYYTMKVWPGNLCTEGGPKRNPKAQVVDPWDNPIPRLYSAGELGSIAGFLYQGANDIGGECMAFGRIAGRNAAAEAPW
ncbi:MAG: FAD-binding protein [Acidobacteria bacterium]|nr:FAD-binding protein [Acidobacteriota bacterium]